MARFGFVGGSYSLQDIAADCQSAINLFPQSDESGFGKSAIIQLPTPGTRAFATAPSSGAGRGTFTFNGRTFAVSGTILYEALSSGSTASLGSLSSDGMPVSWAANPTQLIIASGGIVYCLVLATNALSVVTALSGIDIIQIGYSDGFFLALVRNGIGFYISAPEDGTTWDLGNFSDVSVYAENVLAMIIDHREPWFFGSKRSQPYYNSGAANTPYVPISGGFVEEGIIAPFSVTQIDNSIFWLGGSADRGAGIAWRANGYTPTRVSNHAIEFAIQSYAVISDAVAYSYQDQGHAFYVLCFPTANVTWVYDVATQQWHQRASGAQAQNAHTSMAHTYNFGKHLVCNAVTGDLNELSNTVYTDVGEQIIYRVRRAPHVSTEQQWIFHSQLQVDVEVGLGPIPPLTNPDGSPRGPRMNLRWSDDGGKTWSNYYPKDCGQSGQYKKRVLWRRLGKSRDRVFEVSMSDPIPWRIVDAYLLASGEATSFKPQERLVKTLGKIA